MLPKIGDPYSAEGDDGKARAIIIHPIEVDLQIGTLVVRTGPKPHQASVIVDGKAIKVRNIVIRGGVGQRWTCEMEFFPDG